jgi:hypothetical protein
MLTIKGGSKSKKSKNGMRGGDALMPASFGGANGQPTIPANYVKMPNIFPSKQVGGSYGFSDSEGSSTYGGSYAPWSKSCTSGAIAGRGGNDVMSGGRRKRKSSTKRRRSSTKRSSTKRSSKSKRKSSTKRKSKSKKGGKKYSQRGCSKKMKGGLIVF